MKTLRNKVYLIGNLGKNPEVITLTSGRKLAKFTLATSSYYKNTNGERIKDTQWHNIVAWGSSAGVIEKYLKKGSQIAVDGQLQYRGYESKAGEKKYITEIILNDFTMLQKKD